jgi:cytidyltransferase-like protein
MKTGVILARLQPIHNGHLALIKKAVAENDEVYIFIGSADKFNQRNPLPISLRLQLTQEAIDFEFDKPWTNSAGDLIYIKDRIHIVPLDDLTDESDNSHDWGFYLYSKIVTETKNPCFTIYYSDGFEIITTWFPSFILRNNVSLCLLARNATVDGISATKIRKMIEEDSNDLDAYVPKCVIDRRDTIKKHIELSKLIK